jgi:hypothetical protein
VSAVTVRRTLVAEREKWKRRFQGRATQQPGYRIIGRAIFNTRQRLRAALLKHVQERWDLEHPVDEIERQLSGLKLSQDVKTTLAQIDEMPPLQKRLAETIMTLPGTTIEEEFRRRNAAIDAVAAYCHFQEGGAAALLRKRSFTRRASPTPSKEANPQLAAAEAEKQALSDAMLLVFTEKRTTTCFLCLGEQSLPFEKRTYKFASPGDLIKHFKRKHLAHIKEGDRLKCKVCRMGLQHKQHLQNHAETIHGPFPSSLMIYPERIVKELAFAPSFLPFSDLSQLHACSEQLSSGRDQIRRGPSSYVRIEDYF